MSDKVYLVWVANRNAIFATRSLQNAYASREAAEEARKDILLTTPNGPDDVTIEELAVISK